jgi:hypothetical protein
VGGISTLDLHYGLSHELSSQKSGLWLCKSLNLLEQIMNQGQISNSSQGASLITFASCVGTKCDIEHGNNAEGSV